MNKSQHTRINISRLSKAYGKTAVLEIDEFSFSPGKIYVIIGSNGSGKSTLLKLMAGIIKPDRKSADIDFGAQKVCYMPQKNYAFSMSTFKNVMLTSKGGETDKARATELMREMKIDLLAKNRASKLSGGETARMALCRIMLSGASVLLLDEPTASMDIESTLLSEALIRRYKEENNAAIIMVTHSVSQAMRLADEVIFMKNGRIVEHGTADEVLTNPREKDTKEFLEFFSR